MASIESEVVSILNSYNPNIKTFPFEIPDTDNSTEAIAYRNIGSRRMANYYEKTKEVRLTRFHIVRVCNSYSQLTDDLEFQKLLNKYTGGSILDTSIIEVNDHKIEQTNKFERVYHIDVYHVINFI